MARAAGLEFSNESAYRSLLIIPVLGTISNLLLLIAFIKDPLKCFRNSGTCLVMNLAVSDCLTCLFYFYFVVHPKPFMIYRFFLPLLASASFVSIMSISIDRLLMVAYPMKYRTMMKGKIILLWLAAIWLVSSIIPLLTNLSESSVKISLSAMIIFGGIVVILSLVMYSCTYYKLKIQSRNIVLQNSSQSRAQVIRILKEKRFLNTIIIIGILALVGVVPSVMYFFIINFIALELDHMASVSAFILSSLLFQFNFAVNPSIYFLRLPNYRKTFYAIYCGRRTTAHS